MHKLVQVISKTLRFTAVFVGIIIALILTTDVSRMT